MRCRSTIGALVLLVSLVASSARAAVILDLNGALDLGDSSQFGRLSRNGVPQDWTGAEPFPGVLNAAVAYRYHTYPVNVGITTFLQILFDSISANTFVSAYLDVYAPNSAGAPNLGFDRNWLGDAGRSGNFFGIDPLFFQVRVPEHQRLVLVVSTTAASGVGLGDPFHLTVEGFIDSEFGEPTVPEPAAISLLSIGVAVLAGRRRALHTTTTRRRRFPDRDRPTR